MTRPRVAERLDSDLKDAMRSREVVRLGAIRRARAALKNAEIEARGPLPDDAAARVLRGLVKQHRESIDQFRAGGRDDLVARETEMAVLEAYLPAQMDEAAIAAVVSEVIAAEDAAGPGDLGRVMKASMSRVAAAPTGNRSGRSPNACWKEIHEHDPTDTAAGRPPGGRSRPRGRPRPSAAAPTRRPTP